jgi:virginiamycin B lyase
MVRQVLFALLAIAGTDLLFAGGAKAALPADVRPPLMLTYSGTCTSNFVACPSFPLNYTVQSVSGNSATVKTNSGPFTCTDGVACTTFYQFWVDPTNPNPVYYDKGGTQLTRSSSCTNGVICMAASNSSGGGSTQITAQFDAASGLLFSYSYSRMGGPTGTGQAPEVTSIKFNIMAPYPLGCPFTVTSKTLTDGESFRQVPGKLASISLGGTQTGAVAVWGINSAQNIYSFNGLFFDSIPGSLTQISVDGDSVTGINANKDIFAIGGLAGFFQIPGKLTQISAHGLAVWGINANQQVYQLTGSGFQQVAGKLVQIAVDGTSVWGINANQNVFTYNGTQFVQVPGLLTQIAVGGLGAEVWGLNASQQIYRFNGNAFAQIPGNLKMIAVGGPCGNVGVWGINAANNVFAFDGTGFVPVPGQLIQIAVFGDAVWGINSNQDIFRYGY